MNAVRRIEKRVQRLKDGHKYIKRCGIREVEIGNREDENKRRRKQVQSKKQW